MFKEKYSLEMKQPSHNSFRLEAWCLPMVSYFFKGYCGSILGVKRPGREADHSPPSGANVRNELDYKSIHQYVFMMETGKTLPFAILLTIFHSTVRAHIHTG